MRKAKQPAKPPVYIKVVCAIFTNGSQVLLFKKKENGVYEFPGGKVEKGETYQTALIRELNEELEYISTLVPTYFTHVRGLAGKRKILLRAYLLQEIPKVSVLHEHTRVVKLSLTPEALAIFHKNNLLGDLDRRIILQLLRSNAKIR